MQKARACRLGTPCAPRTFKQLLACRTQHHPTLDLDVIADRAQVRRDRLYDYANENNSAQIPFMALLRLCEVVAAWDLVDFALEAHGRRSVEIGRPAAVRSIVAEVMDTTIENGRLVSAVQRAAEDGQVSADEAGNIRQHIRTMRRELDDLDGALDGALTSDRRLA